MSNILKKCGREELLSDVRKEVILAFTYFVHCGIILRDRRVFCSVFVKETLSIIRFFNAAKLLLADWFQFLMCFNKKIFAKYGKYADLQTTFSEKNIWRSSQVFRGIAVPKFQGNRSVLKCDRVWLFDRNLLSKYSSLSYIIRRSDFQAKILKEIHNNYSEL